MPDERRPSISIGSPDTLEERAARAALGDGTPEKLALAEALKAHETQLTDWLQDPANRERLIEDPLAALADVLPEEILKGVERPPKIRADVRRRLGTLELKEVAPPRTPAMDLFDKVWTFVVASSANLSAFVSDVNGTVRAVDPNAPQPVVDEVIAAFDTVFGIAHLAPISPQYFSNQILTGRSPGALIEHP
jgi:hypothetical protein